MALITSRSKSRQNARLRARNWTDAVQIQYKKARRLKTPTKYQKSDRKLCRRGWDSNPRDPFGPNGFQDRRSQPLSFPSAKLSLLATSHGSNWEWKEHFPGNL